MVERVKFVQRRNLGQQKDAKSCYWDLKGCLRMSKGPEYDMITFVCDFYVTSLP